MDTLFFFTVAGIAIVILILNFDKKQTIKVNTLLNETRSVPPLFLLKSTEQKVSTLKTVLHYDDAPQSMAAIASMVNIYNSQKESHRQAKVQEFKMISARYNSGLMTLKAYNSRLDELLEDIQHDSALFELAC